MSNPVRLGVLRLTDSAPAVLAEAAGLFAAEDLDVTLQVEPSWANVADKLCWGKLEAAIMLPFFIIIWGCINYVHDYYSARITLSSRAKTCAWAYANDGHLLDSKRPESLVYERKNGKQFLAAAMYSLPPGSSFAAVPDLGGPLTQFGDKSLHPFPAPLENVALALHLRGQDRHPPEPSRSVRRIGSRTPHGR